jgi:transcriptional regulator with XRE-family HTH domain
LDFVEAPGSERGVKTEVEDFDMHAYDRYYLSDMQALSIKTLPPLYDAAMPAEKSQRSAFGEQVRLARETAGLNQRQVAAQLGISQPSYALWEINEVALRPEQIIKLAQILGVRVEELLSSNTSGNRRGGPAGKAKRVFEQVSQLPRSQQQKILGVVEALIAQHGKTA